ncbi:MAG: GNAT family N-acetyltransferase [Rhodothermales bacterium]|nr:GNAT family N-acetyltransferase [Rhodothermales bacterium]MBO6780748.1 GNAT family N-acetyltransferase [Rhodothermales bacterium]
MVSAAGLRLAPARRPRNHGEVTETPAWPGPFGRTSFLQPWWKYVAPGWLNPDPAHHALGQAVFGVAAGFGAADYATPDWNHLEAALDTAANRGLILPRVLEGTALHAWCTANDARSVPYDVNPMLDLRPGWQTIADRRSARTWSSIRRKRRKLEQEGRLEIVHVRDAAELRQWLPAAFALYRARASRVRRGLLWTTAPGQRFLRNWMLRLADEGALDLAVLLVGSHPAAFTFGINDPDTYYLYGLAFDPGSRLARWSPGEHLLIHLMQQATEGGRSTFDFLVGDEPYKRAWADHFPHVETQVVARGAVRVRLLESWPRMRQLIRRGLRG